MDAFQQAGVEQSWGGLKWTQSRKAVFAASTAACHAVGDVLLALALCWTEGDSCNILS